MPIPDSLRNKQGYERCLRSGYCCKTATCVAGRIHGAESVGCKFLKGSQPGEYSCQLVEVGMVRHEDLAIGAGCCAPMNTDHYQLALKVLREKRA